MNKNTLKIILVISSFSFFFVTSASQAQTLRYSQDIYFGLKNHSVTTLQTDLSTDSTIYPEKLVTGYFGQLTLKAVKRFQVKYGIRQTGYVGPLTRAKLNQLYIVGSNNEWGCRYVTQGIAPNPNNPPPIVCGYIPNCFGGQVVVASLGEGIWLDGSLKGVFSCSSMPPSSVPQ